MTNHNHQNRQREERHLLEDLCVVVEAPPFVSSKEALTGMVNTMTNHHHQEYKEEDDHQHHLHLAKGADQAVDKGDQNGPLETQVSTTGGVEKVNPRQVDETSSLEKETTILSSPQQAAEIPRIQQQQPPQRRRFFQYFRRRNNNGNEAESSPDKGAENVIESSTTVTPLALPTPSGIVVNTTVNSQVIIIGNCYDSMVSMPPHQYSITFFSNAQQVLQHRRLGFTLEEDAKTGNLLIFSLEGTGDFIQPRADQLPMDISDILVSINTESCNGQVAEEAMKKIQMTPGLVTLLFQKNVQPSQLQSIPKANTTQHHHSHLHHTHNHAHDTNNIRQAIFLSPQETTCIPNDIDLESTCGHAKDTKCNSPDDANIINALTIQALRGDWLTASCLAVGQVVLKLNSCNCYDMTPDDALAFLSTKSSLKCHISVKVLDVSTLPRFNKAALRKNAVAVSGGAIVATGAVLMVTPLHPVGHAMTIGGLGILGTEFEGPRKMTQRSMESMRNLTKQVSKTFRRTTSRDSTTEGEEDSAIQEWRERSLEDQI